MKSKILALLAVLGLSLNTFGASSMTPAVSDLPVVVTQVSNLTVEVSTKVDTNDLSSTTVGSEGIRIIGALGGYTLEEFLEDTATRGPARDLPQFLYTTTNLTITYSEGDVYDPQNGYFKLDSGSKTLTDNAVNYAYWSTNDTRIIQWTTGTRPSSINNIYLATFITSQGRIINVNDTMAVGDALLYEDEAFSKTFPSLIINGLNVYPTGTSLTNIIINSGVEYHNLAKMVEHDAFNLNTSNNVVVYTHSNSVWSTTTTNLLPVGLWDNGSDLVTCTADKWYRGVFVSIGGDSQQLSWIAPDYEYADEATALVGSDPDLPPAFVPYIPKCTAYVFKGDDTELRTNLTYWVDRRNSDNLLKGSVTGSGSSGNTPTLGQVLLAGTDTGGILPTGMGTPVTDDQGASKGYVDSVGNKASTGTAFVDAKKGDDNTGRIQKASLPFKTIQAAIDACAVVATDTNRFLISISIGTYVENLIMKDFISIRGYDVEATIIEGQITYPSSYTDLTGGELSILSVRMTNAPALIFNVGDDTAYGGARSCAFYSTYDTDASVKSVIQISRGNLELYSTCWVQLDVTNNATATQRPASIYYLTTDGANSGTYHVNSFSSSHVLNIVDTNDTTSIVFCNSTNESFFASKSDATHMHLDDSDTHANRVTTIVHKNASRTRSFIDSSIVDVKLSVVNNCDIIAVSSTGSTYNAVAHFNNSRIIVPNVSTGNLFYGSASTTSDFIEVVNSQIGALTTGYPKRYTEAGSSGQITYFIQHGLGDILLGGGIDIKTGTPTIMPESGHVKFYAYTYAGLENPMFMDSSGNAVRLARDNFFNGYNDEATAMSVGEVVYMSAGLSGSGTPKIKRSNASKIETLPAMGIVSQKGGIAAGSIGRVMLFGRLENPTDTSSFASGNKLYVSATVDGGLTNVAPTGTNVSQQIGWCHVSSTNGYINVRPYTPDTLGNRVPQDYATYDNPVFSSSLFIITNSASAKFSTANIQAGTTNTYILPADGGILATYTDIQIVPVSVVVGEVGGIAKGRVVYQSGSVGGRPQVKYASRDEHGNLPVIGVTSSSGDLGDIIEVVQFGPVRNIDTSAFSANGSIYLGTNGMLMGQSSNPNDAIILMGTCLTSNSTTGSMLVNIRSYYQDGAFAGSMRYAIQNASSASNATANFFALNELQEAMRMGIRSTNNFQGQGSYLVSGANGRLVFGNLRRQGYVWNIDMTDSSNIYEHNKWPMMSLVPQIATSNAFFGIGTTNPLTMLDVMGSATASNMFRRSTSGYIGNELMTYGDVTNLVTSASNTLYSADTNLSARINTETNRAITAEVALTNFVVSVSNNLNTANTNLQAQINTETNRAITSEVALTNFVVSASNSLYSADTNLSARINTETNRAITSEVALTNFVVSSSNRLYNIDTNLQVQVTDTTNHIRQIESQTNTWNTASTPSTKFLANIGKTVNYSVPQPLTRVIYTNLISNVGGTYSNSVARWIPGTSNVYVQIKGSIRITNVANDNTILLQIYKNGLLKSTIVEKTMRTGNFGETYAFTDITTNSADYYEVWSTMSNARSTTGSGADNWWSGQVLY